MDALHHNLADDLRQAADVVDNGLLASAVVNRLSAAVAAVELNLAILAAARLLDPAGTKSAWCVAGELELKIERFESTAWPRIRKGYRAANNPLEIALAAIMEHKGPGDQRRLSDYLRAVRPTQTRQ